MGSHVDPETKMAIVLDLLKSKKTVSKYAREKGIPSSTLNDWKRKYFECTEQSVLQASNGIIDITNEAKEIALVNSTVIPICQTNKETETFISSAHEKTIPNNIIKLSTSKFTLEFDVSNLNTIIKAFDD